MLIRPLLTLGAFTFALSACGLLGTPAHAGPVGLPTAVAPDSEFAGDYYLPFIRELPPDTFHPGPHRYQIRINCPALFDDPMVSERNFFEASEEAEVFAFPIYLRLFGLSLAPLLPPDLTVIHPHQRTIAVVTVLGVSENLAREIADMDCQMLIYYDDAPPLLLTPAEPYLP